MNEQELRQLVRQAIAAHVGANVPAAPNFDPALTHRPARAGGHISHGLFVLTDGAADGPCLIEPAVPCTHCGYCKSLGH
jgi:hypothetical protein